MALSGEYRILSKSIKPLFPYLVSGHSQSILQLINLYHNN